jgi:hypothetical protein
MKLTLSLAAAVSAALLAIPASAVEPAGAQSFLTGLYSHYPYRRGAPIFDAAGRSAPQVFDPALVTLIRDSERLTPDGDAPPLDGDPICDCQDSAGMKSRIGAVRATGRATASGRVDITFAAVKPPEVRRLDFDLVQSRGQWRVHDIHSKDMPSLRAFLIQANREAAAAAKKK